jgi:prepilin-type N-terminal cleavage/methylation domain-containing protein
MRHSCTQLRHRQGITLLELLIVIAAVAVIVLIAIPTLQPSKEDEAVSFAKDQLQYLYARQQEYFNLHGKYAPLSVLAADPNVGPNLDKRFVTDESIVSGVIFKGPKQEGVIFDIIAELPDGSQYKIDQTGMVVQVSQVE